MRKNTKIIIIVSLIIIVVIGIFWYQINRIHQKTVNQCKEMCRYGVKENTYKSEGVSRYLNPETKTLDVWGFYLDSRDSEVFRKFETQDQCVDYCVMELTK